MGTGLIAIRPMSLDDVDAAADLEARYQPTPWSERVLLDELTADNRVYLVIDDGALAGFGGVMLVGEEAHITNLLVDVRLRGRGLGRRLLVALVSAAIGAGARHLTLEVRSENETARSLYASFGLAPVGVRPGYYGDDDALIMWAHDIDSSEYRSRLGLVPHEVGEGTAGRRQEAGGRGSVLQMKASGRKGEKAS